MKMYSRTALFCASIFLLYSCSKNNNNNTDQLASLTKATVTGYASAKLIDTIGATGMQRVPTSTTITAWIDTRDLVLNANSSTQYAKRYYNVTVNENGFYTILVDVSKNRPVTVHIEGQDFDYSVMKNTGFPASATNTYYERKIFTATPITVEATTEDKVIRDVVYH
jgi:hypothetical protein